MSPEHREIISEELMNQLLGELESEKASLIHALVMAWYGWAKEIEGK